MGIVIESQTFIGAASGVPGARAQVWLPPGFTLACGGAFDPARGATSALSVCCPTRDEDGRYTGWTAAAMDGEAPVAVYAVGLRVLRNGVPLRIDQQVFCATSALAADPGVTVRLGSGWIGTGGGAQDNHASAGTGSIVTASHPLLDASGRVLGWSASGRAGQSDAPARISAFVVGIRTVPEVALDPGVLAACLQPSLPAAAGRGSMLSISPLGPRGAGSRARCSLRAVSPRARRRVPATSSLVAA